MSDYNFDEIVDRKNTNSLKFDFNKERGKPEDVLPLWVADMDFRVPKEVRAALVTKAEHGIFGYSEPTSSYFKAINNWFNKNYNWDINTSKLVLTPGVVYSICIIIRLLTNENDCVLLSEPVYYPFKSSIVDNHRKVVINELVFKNDHYEFDFDDFERKIRENNVKLYILCNPHNPVGRVWRIEELKRINEICTRNNVFVVSDEIHADFVYGDNKHIPYQKINEANSVICTAPSKTFNIPGLHISNTYIYDDDLRKRFILESNKQGYSQPNIMGIVGCEAAYKYGQSWLIDLKEYLLGNINFVDKFLKENISQIKLIKPEGTYLVWLDFKALGLNDKDLNELIISKAKLWFDGGTMFGKSGSGYQRMNIATSRSVLEQALNQLKKAIINFNIDKL